MSLNLSWLAKLAVVALIAYGALGAWQHRAISHGPGVVAPNAPQQRLLDESQRRAFTHNEHQITPLAEFSLAARVLGNERYRLSGGAEIAPLDLALAWGPMSDESVLEQMEFEHGNRWLSWYPQNVAL